MVSCRLGHYLGHLWMLCYRAIWLVIHLLLSYLIHAHSSAGTDIEEALASLQQYEDKIWVISQVIQNDIR